VFDTTQLSGPVVAAGLRIVPPSAAIRTSVVRNLSHFRHTVGIRHIDGLRSPSNNFAVLARVLSAALLGGA